MGKRLFKRAKVYTKTEAAPMPTIYDRRKLALEILDKVFPEQKGKEKLLTDIHNGYTNFSFLAILEDGSKYQVRLPHDGKLINRKNEDDLLQNYLDAKDFAYFDVKTGICVKKWYDGITPKRRTLKSPEFLDKLFKQIKKMHNLPLKKVHNFKPIKFDAYCENLYRLKFHLKKKYLCLIDRRQDDKLVINHTDINPLNIVYNKEENNIKIIDYEWCGLASDYYDYANFIRETGIDYRKIDFSKYIDDFDMQIFEHYLFLTSVYSYLWTYVMPQTKKIIKYRYKTLKQIRKYYPCVVNVDKCNYVGRKNEK